MRRLRVPRAGLAARFGAAGVLVVVLAALVLGLVGARIVQNVSDAGARKVLRMVADADAERVKAGLPARPDNADLTALDKVVVQRATITRGTSSGAAPGPAQGATPGPAQGATPQPGTTATRVTGALLAREALSPAQITRVLAGEDVSAVIRRDGVAVFVEARPTPQGGIVVAQRRPDGLTQSVADSALPPWIWAAAGVAAAGALLVGLLAWLTGRPLRRLTVAAGDLAAGRRDVALPERGPAEVATLAREVNALAAALARSEARQREFLMSVSHDLRTPLTTLKGYAETLAEGGLDPGATREAGEVMAAESARLERMVGDLLTLARLEADEVVVHRVAVDVGGLLVEADKAWVGRIAAAELTMSVQVPDGVVRALADPERLRQVLDNLIDNAVRVCPPGATLLLVARGEQGDQGGPATAYVVIEVRDGGPGLTADDLAVTFERGALRDRYRGRREVGTGLGLTLVDGLVRRMGGTVTAGRAPEGGAAFTIRLPAAP